MIDFIEQPIPQCTISPAWAGLPVLHLTRIVPFEYWYETLSDHAFYLQKASNFVDKNDCVGFCSGKLSVEAARKHLMGGHAEIHVSDDVARSFGDNAALILNDRIAKRDFMDFAYWVLCASDAGAATQESERRAWKEYVSDYTGVQFHFDFPLIQLMYCNISAVRYVKELPSINLCDAKDDLVYDEVYNEFFDRCIFSKLESKYSWEHEYRFLIDDRTTICNCNYVQILHKRLSYDDRLHPYLRLPPKMITKIVFGCGVPQDSYATQITEVRENQDFEHITFSRQVYASSGSFRYEKI